MIEQFFDDADHRASEDLAFRAELRERAGEVTEARSLYVQAAETEARAAARVPQSVPRVRTLFAISVTALWLRAGAWDEAARAGCGFLAERDGLTSDGRRELESLIERAWRARELEALFGREADAFAGVEARLIGGEVRAGLAPAALVAERRDVLVTMLYRVAEWRAKRKFRRAGTSAFASSFDIVEAPARAASFGVRVFLGRTGQQVTATEPTHPQEIVASLLDLASAAAEDRLATRVEDPLYARAFARAFRELAGDGAKVERVELASIDRRRSAPVALGREERSKLTASLTERDAAHPLEFRGVLKSVNLRGREPTIWIERVGEPAVKLRIAKGEHDDTIGPKLNRSVLVLGRHDVSDEGEAEDWADDVVLLEDVQDDRPA